MPDPLRRTFPLAYKPERYRYRRGQTLDQVRGYDATVRWTRRIGRHEEGRHPERHGGEVAQGAARQGFLIELTTG